MLQEEHHQQHCLGCLSSYYPQNVINNMGSAQFEVPPISDHDTLTCSSFQSSNPSSFEENHPVLQSAGTLQSLVKSGYGTSFGRNHSSVTENSILRPHHQKNPKVEATFSVTSCVSVTKSKHIPESSSKKGRIRWTHDLHDRFLECVNNLGGADKATPKKILKMMNSNGLTIFHVKSHLQKYRMAKYVPKSSVGEKHDTDYLQQLDLKTGEQIVEALMQQIHVQRRLCEQLESQGHLQRQIEEQGKQLKEMLEHQIRKNPTSN